MKVVYLKGLSTNEEELAFIKEKFNAQGIEFINLVDDYNDFYKKSKEEIRKILSEKIHNITWQTEPVTLVCHSMGCNYGILLDANLCLLKNVVFISPEFQKMSKEEKDKIIASTNETTKEPSQMKFGIKKMKNICAFLDSKEWLDEEINNFLNKKSRKTAILYSKGDIYVSRDVINQMAEADFINSYEIDTNNHNPLLENTNCIDIIKKEIEDVDQIIKR